MKRKALRRLPAFSPVPTRARRDGWTPQRQAAFLGLLAETGSVREAASRAGMARETAYRLRRRAGAESFADAWDTIAERLRGSEATPPKRKVTREELERRALFGQLRPLIYRGRFTGVTQITDIAALLRYCRQRLPMDWSSNGFTTRAR